MESKKNKSAAEYMPTSSIFPWKDNPRDNEPAVDKVAASIRKFGFGAPILVRSESREIIAGHTRWMAAKSLGLTEVPVRMLDLDEKEAHLLAVADNKLGEIASWDHELLASTLSDYELDEAVVAGWTEVELEKLKKIISADTAAEQLDGAEEIDVDGFDVNATCPRCRFEFRHG